MLEFSPDNILAFHIINSVIFFWMGFLTGRFSTLSRTKSQKESKLDIKSLFKIFLQIAGLLLFVVFLIDAQFFDGEPPSLFVSCIGAYCFGSLVGDKNLLMQVLEAVSKKGK